MALTVTPVERTAVGRMKLAIADVTFDSSYASGGEVLDPLLLGLSEVLFVLVEDSGDGNVVQWVRSSGKLKVLGSGTTDAVLNEAGADNLASKTVRVIAYGI